MALTPREDTLATVFLKHQLWPNRRPSFKSTSAVGQTVVVTGGNRGIGLECEKLLLSLGLAHLVMAVRSVQRGEEAAAYLRKRYPKVKIDVWPLDMDSYESIRAFAARCTDLPRLDVAILNAGIFNLAFEANPTTGHEANFQVNYMSTALLALLLLPKLKSASPNGMPGRLTLVASGAALIAEFSERNEVPLLAAFDKQDGWDSSAAKKRYDTSKGLVLMLTLILSKMVKAEDVVVNVVDPTFTPGTDFFRNLPLMARFLLYPLVTLVGTSVNSAAWRYVDAAVARGPETHGSFLSDWVIHPYVLSFPSCPSTLEVDAYS
jgi:NAD(P)-dependent dehydrogenase (short-subunit alcohol dehydrogenase family)